MIGITSTTSNVEVTKFPETISKWEFANRFGNYACEYGGESETGGGGGGGESQG
tara:strand:+ start:293 stop:454 length:162 start_codon:yes stop_codon:yes gene_type:complete